jgi:hypothetical protein
MLSPSLEETVRPGRKRDDSATRANAEERTIPDLLGRPASPSEVTSWLQSGLGQEQVEVGFLSSGEYDARQAADGCNSTASLFGSGAYTSTLSAVIEDPAAANPARQGCMWEKGTRVTYGPPPGPLTTGSLSQQK